MKLDYGKHIIVKLIAPRVSAWQPRHLVITDLASELLQVSPSRDFIN